MREMLGVGCRDIFLISVGEVNKNKNHRIIIEALSILKMHSSMDETIRCYDELKYFVIGQGSEMEKLKALVRTLDLENNVYFMGFQKDVRSYLEAADIFCFPSKREGLGLAAVEAMAMGLPLITSNVHGINDYSINGMSGYACNPNDAESFAKAIDTLAKSNDQRVRMGEYNRKQAARFDENIVSLKMKTVYTSLLR